jgi:hypothetical protein
MYEGTVPGGDELLPGVVVHGALHDVGGLVEGRETVRANPLNAAGALPPERLFHDPHRASHQVKVLDGLAAPTVTSPRENAPRLGKANTIATLLVSDDGR